MTVIALTMTDVAFSSRPPHRPNRPARKANQGARILGLFRQIGTELGRGIRGANGLPRVTRRWPY